MASEPESRLGGPLRKEGPGEEGGGRGKGRGRGVGPVSGSKWVKGETFRGGHSFKSQATHTSSGAHPRTGQSRLEARIDAEPAAAGQHDRREGQPGNASVPGRPRTARHGTLAFLDRRFLDLAQASPGIPEEDG